MHVSTYTLYVALAVKNLNDNNSITGIFDVHTESPATTYNCATNKKQTWQ